MSFRTYSQVPGEDRSGLLAQVEAQRQRVTARLRTVGRVVAVMSGKGGVGKSFVTAALAAGMAARGRKVGVVDADLRSPTVSRLLDAQGPLKVTDSGVTPATAAGGVLVVSTDLLLAEGEPLRWREPPAERFVWRGALEMGALREFLGDIEWGALDLLLVDLPPGSDGVIDLHALVPDLTGALLVTIPSDEAHRSVERTARAARDDGIRLLGVIENMSGYACPDCSKVGPLFPGDAGNRIATTFGIPLLGTIPFQSHHAAPPAPLAAFMEALG